MEFSEQLINATAYAAAFIFFNVTGITEKHLKERYNDLKQKRRSMIMRVLFYGSTLCSDCQNALALFEKNNVKADFRSITEDLGNLKEFLQIRDNNAAYTEVKKNGGIGIPLFVFEDGAISFDEQEALAQLKK